MSGLRETHKRPARALDILVGLFAVCVAALVILAAVHHVGRTLLERRAAIEAERARVLEHERAYAEWRRAHAAWERRDVVAEVGVSEAEWDGVSFRFSGWMRKRECALASENPYNVVDFWREGGDRVRLDYEFMAGREHGAARPGGTTPIEDWSIVIGADGSAATEIAGYASHDCSGITIGPREFVRFTIGEALAGGVVWRSETADAPEPLWQPD